MLIRLPGVPAIENYTFSIMPTKYGSLWFVLVLRIPTEIRLCFCGGRIRVGRVHIDEPRPEIRRNVQQVLHHILLNHGLGEDGVLIWVGTGVTHNRWPEDLGQIRDGHFNRFTRCHPENGT